jgi:hypothetical protein
MSSIFEIAIRISEGLLCIRAAAFVFACKEPDATIGTGRHFTAPFSPEVPDARQSIRGHSMRVDYVLQYLIAVLCSSVVVVFYSSCPSN